MNNSIKERTIEFVKFKGITMKSFETKCGLSSGYVTSMRKGFGSDKLNDVLTAFPELNRDWLLYGEGSMLKDENGGKGQTPAKRHLIRYWVDVDATGGGVELFDDSLTSRHIDLDIPEFRDCTDAVNLYGDSMFPLYKSGQIIILKEWRESYIDFGNVYLVVTKNGNRMVKYLRKGSDDAHILCVSENKDFDPFEIEKENIIRLFLVKGGIVKNTL